MVSVEEGSPLTEYEKTQVSAIAAWKGETPSPVKRLIHSVTDPVGKWVHKIIPSKPVQSAMEALNKAASQIAQDDAIFEDAVLQSAGIQHITDLKNLSLQEADALADRIISDASHIALGMGAATGAGGPVATAVGIPTLLFNALRVIHRVSTCYSYRLENEDDRTFMLGILSLSMTATPEQRAEAMEHYRRRIQTSFLNQAIEGSASKALQRTVLGAELGAMIPGFGIAFNAYLSRDFVRRAGITAKRVFQERWLRDRGKVVWITPQGPALYPKE